MSYTKRTGKEQHKKRREGKPKGTVGYLQTVQRERQIFNIKQKKRKKNEKGREREKEVDSRSPKAKRNQHLISGAPSSLDTAQKLKTPSEREWDRK